MPAIFAEGLQFPEGPAFDRAGNLYVVEIRAGQISRITPSGECTVFAETGGGPNGSNFGPDGNLYVTNNGGFDWLDRRPHGRSAAYETGRIERVYPDGRVERLYSACDGAPLRGCNDLVFDAQGNFYFTDPGHPENGVLPPGQLFFATTDGRLIKQLETGFQFPNGIGITDDGRTLIVAETRAATLWAYDIDAPGAVSGKREFARLPEKHLPDGFCFDAAGNLICAGVRGGALIVFDRNGRQIDRIASEDEFVTNAAFGGPGFSTLYVTESVLGRVVTLDWPTQGMRLFPDRIGD